MKKNRKIGALYFTGISVVHENYIVLTGNYYALEDSEEERIAFLVLNNRQWGGMDLSGTAHSIGFQGNANDPNRRCLVVERNKGLYEIRPKNNVAFTKINENRPGFLMDLRRIGGKWYSVGGHHQIYRENLGKWDPVDQQIFVPGEEGQTKILLSIDGNSESDIYTVGFNGVIFHSDGQNWRQIDSPTHVGLQRVLCVSREENYICGYRNTFFRGNVSYWEPLTDLDSDITYWDMAYFQGQIFVCSKKKLYILQNDQLEEVDVPVEGPLGFYRMDSNERALWTCGNECLLKFDGKKWEQYVFPDNI